MDDHETPGEGQNTHEDISAAPALQTTSTLPRGVIGAGLLIIVAILAVAAVSYLFPGSGGRTETESGLQFTDEVVGSGDPVEEGDMVLVHYTGYLEDGTEFDSSFSRGQPLSFMLGTGPVIDGWHEGIAGMQVGGKRELIIPPELAYGEAGAGGVIPPNATLRFEVELVGTVELEIEDVVVGEGPEVTAGSTVTLEFAVMFEDGTEMDSSANAGPLEFVAGVGQMIPGVDAGVMGMQVGGQRIITVPPEFAFGAQGVPDGQGGFLIPPDAVLIFEVELTGLQ